MYDNRIISIGDNGVNSIDSNMNITTTKLANKPPMSDYAIENINNDILIIGGKYNSNEFYNINTNITLT